MGDNSDLVETIKVPDILGTLQCNQPPLTGIVITIINRVYYILQKRLTSRLVCRIRKKLIKILLCFMPGITQ